MQIFGILSGVVLLIVLGGLAVIAALLIILVGTLVFLFYGRHHAQRSGVLKIYGHRPASYLLYRNPKKGKIKVNESDQEIPLKEPDTSLDAVLVDQAGTVIPLFGKERSPEMLVEMGAALAHGRKVQVVHLKEVPDITYLDALLEDSPVITSLNRRISAMSKEREVDVDFESAVTHDLVGTVHKISMQTHCNWLVAGWDGKSGQGLFIRNPIGWLVTHLDSNFALFKDNGVRYIRKILIAQAPGRNEKSFIIACDRIASYYNAEITLIRVVDVRTSEADIEKLQRKSEILLHKTSSKSKIIILKGKDPVKIISEASAAYDLLVIGPPLKASRLDVLFGADKDKFADSAVCSILRLSIK